MNLYRKGEHIVDVETCTVYSKGCSITFNFDEMSMYNNKTKSDPKAIKYDGRNILCWISKQWKGWSDEETQDAINSLFHAYTDRQILK